MATIKSIEEKAKAYDEAIKRVEDIVGGKCPKPFVFTEGLFDYIFPELKESEDEKIRKALICGMYTIKEQHKTCFASIPIDNVIAWLEKRGEQKETLCDKCKKTQPSHSCQDITALGRCALEKQGEQKLTEFERAVKQVMEEAIECGDTHNLKADAEMLLSLVHKSAWSEEDEINLERAIWYVENPVRMVIKNSTLIEWLKELKHRVQPQSTWKPSDEQMETLENVRKILHSNKEIYSKINHFMFNFEELIRTLKKLMEE